MVKYCDGWMPLTWVDPNIIAEIRDLRRVAEKAAVTQEPWVTVFGAPADAKGLAAYSKAGSRGSSSVFPTRGRKKCCRRSTSASAAVLASPVEGIYIVGVGMTPFGKLLGRSVKDLSREAVTAALDDAGCTIADLEAVQFSNAVRGTCKGRT